MKNKLKLNVDLSKMIGQHDFESLKKDAIMALDGMSVTEIKDICAMHTMSLALTHAILNGDPDLEYSQIPGLAAQRMAELHALTDILDSKHNFH